MEQWKEYKLGDISNMKYGKLPPKQNNGSYPIWSGYRNVGFATTYNCRKGTIIVVARGVGGTGDVKISSEDCFLTNLSIAVELDNKICEPLYFYYKYKLSNLRYLDTGSAQSQITIDDLKRLSLKLPPLEEQKRITEILSSIDYKIELNRRINDNLEQQAQALFKAWFVDNAVIDDASVSDYFIPLRGKNLLTSDAKGGEIPVVAGGLTPSAYHNVANTKAPVITISASGANAGYVKLWGVPVWSADSSYIDSSVTPHIYFWYNLLKFSQKNIFDSQSGSAQPHIYPKHIGDIHIPNLDLDKVADYNKIVTPIYELITNTQKLNMQLTVTRDTLLPKLMSVEIKI
ncbi:restriction endonuclease subunit S [Bacteroides uniformis]|uniref:restriction endonuclease subunit S n=1 Tax=Bacteroides uniformis TaxID=820 RepID=UPI00125D94FC|nr:restriction endonuclease subunit S [Bacteroides uniformis]KAB4153723.1 restriction endonuclease subunit S [Bacteroides uniformis]